MAIKLKVVENFSRIESVMKDSSKTINFMDLELKRVKIILSKEIFMKEEKFMEFSLGKMIKEEIVSMKETLTSITNSREEVISIVFRKVD